MRSLDRLRKWTDVGMVESGKIELPGPTAARTALMASRSILSASRACQVHHTRQYDVVTCEATSRTRRKGKKWPSGSGLGLKIKGKDLALFSRDPPYSSVLMFAFGDRNCEMR